MKNRVKIIIILILCGSMTNALARIDDNALGEVLYAAQKLRSMARFYMAFGDYHKALPLINKAHDLLNDAEIFNEQYGFCLADLAFIHHRLNNLDTAIIFCKESLDIQVDLKGENHPNIAYTLRLMSNIYADMGQLQQAEEAIDLSLEIIRIYYPEGNPFWIPFIIQKAELLSKNELFSEAETIYLKYLPTVQDYYGKTNLYTSNVLTRLGMLYLETNRYEQAKLKLEEALSIQYKIYGEHHHSMAVCWKGLAQVYYAEQNYTEASRFLSLSTSDENKSPRVPLKGIL